MRKDCLVTIDIVIPVHNEEPVIPLLIKRLEDIFCADNLKKHGISKVRYLFIDDGSVDGTLNYLKTKLSINNKAKIISFSRNFGHQAAVSAGIFMADADITAIIDADLQDPPEYILDMLRLWRDEYDVIYGLRKRRNENFFKNVCYKVFYRLYRFLSPVEVPLDSGDFCIMDRKVVDALKSLPEKLRFQRGLRSWVGFSQIGFEYERPRRAAGESKYSLKDLYHLATDGITSMSITPLKVSQFFALIFFLFSLVAVFLLKSNVLKNSGVNPIFILTLIYTAGNAVILFCLYILGAYTGRAYLETKNRPAYIVKENLDIP